MKTLKKTTIFVLLWLLMLPFVMRYSPMRGEAGAVTINFSYVFDAENFVVQSTLTGTFGSKLTLPAASYDHYDFAFWIINGVVNTNPELSEITVSGKMNIQAIFKPLEKYAVVFIDSNGRFIDNKFTDPSGSVIAPSSSGYDKPGLIVNSLSPWKDVITGSTTFENINQDRVYQLQYERNISTGYSLSVNGGTILTDAPITDPELAYNYNQLVTVTAPAENGGIPFSHWVETGTDFRLSYDREYTFTIAENRMLTAIYDQDIVPMPLVQMSDDLGIRPDHGTYIAQYDIPENYELIECGFLFSSVQKVLMKDDAQVITAQQSYVTEETNEYVMSFPYFIYDSIRAYIVVKDISNQSILTIHSIKNISRIPVETYLTVSDDPTIIHSGNTSFKVGSSFDPLTYASVDDQIDQTPELEYTLIKGYTTYPSPVDFSTLSSGTYQLTYQATNSLSNETTATIEITITPPTVYDLVIYEVYAGGGEEGSIYNRDYVVLYNPTSESITFGNASLQIANGTNNFNSGNSVSLYGTIHAHRYRLIGLSEGSYGENLPDYFSLTYATLSLDSSSGKVALVAHVTSYVIDGPSDPYVIDFLGYGTTNQYETQPTDLLSIVLSARRIDDEDTDHNYNDFARVTPDLSYLT